MHQPRQALFKSFQLWITLTTPFQKMLRLTQLKVLPIQVSSTCSLLYIKIMIEMQFNICVNESYYKTNKNASFCIPVSYLTGYCITWNNVGKMIKACHQSTEQKIRCSGRWHTELKTESQPIICQTVVWTLLIYFSRSFCWWKNASQKSKSSWRLVSSGLYKRKCCEKGCWGKFYLCSRLNEM